jgi:hypothetical protein
LQTVQAHIGHKTSQWAARLEKLACLCQPALERSPSSQPPHPAARVHVHGARGSTGQGPAGSALAVAPFRGQGGRRPHGAQIAGAGAGRGRRGACALFATRCLCLWALSYILSGVQPAPAGHLPSLPSARSSSGNLATGSSCMSRSLVPMSVRLLFAPSRNVDPGC